MTEIPHELIRHLQISTRAAAGLSDYDSSHPTLPPLPSLSSEIAASDSPPHLRCDNCKGRFLRGSESLICLYCGRRSNYDAVPQPISFTSSVGYKWLLRSLRLDGSEVVDPRNKREQDQGQGSPKALIPLSDFLDFKIQWPAETEHQETGIPDNFSKLNRSLSLTGVDPVNFFLKLNANVTSDPSIKQQVEHKFGTEEKKSVEVETPDHQNLFKNFQSSESVNFSQPEASEDFSGWEADFQFAESQNQENDLKVSENFADFSNDSGNMFQTARSVDYSMGPEVDLSAQIDSVFGSGKNIDDGKTIENPAVYPAFDDDLWNNFGSIRPHSGGGFDAVDSARGHHEDQKLESSVDLSTSADLLQDFQLQPNYADASMDTTTNEEHMTTGFDSYEEWNDFAGFSTGQDPLQTGSEFQFSTSEQKSPEIDMFSFDSKFEEGGFVNFSQPNLFSPTNTESKSLTEISSIMPENPASIRSYGTTSDPSDISGQPANNGDSIEKSTRDDDVKMLISQMHDLSFMLEADLSIPAAQDAKSPLKD